MLTDTVPINKPCPYMKRWWTRELSELKKDKNKLSKLSYHYRGIPNHTMHTEHKTTSNKLSKRIEEAKKKHCVDCLEKVTTKDMLKPKY